jgi:uncharacterized repeat protein (TIGR03803 family)
METQFTTPHNKSGTCAMTEPASGRKPVLALFIRLLWAAALVLFSFGAQAGLVVTTLHSFTGTNDGQNPFAGLVQGSDGYFYGTTYQGATNNRGGVFRISTNGALTCLYSFTGGDDGGAPYAGLVQGSSGYFYGTTETGGTNGDGTVFKISTNGALTSLYSFTGGNDGANPYAGLVQGSDGSLYGTTSSGGKYTNGTVFKIGISGAFTNLYSFTGGNDGGAPYAGLVRGSDGYLYGTTVDGGTNNYGTVFKISTNGVPAASYLFTGGNDGWNPYAGLVQGSNGSFYGTTQAGGVGWGTMFKISTNLALTGLHSFSMSPEGANPYAGLVQGSDGYLYGTTTGGGTNGTGTVFRLSTNGASAGLYAFTGGNDGATPYAGLVQGSDGNFYGTTRAGGSNNLGTVFRLTVVPAAPQGGLVQNGGFETGDFTGWILSGITNATFVDDSSVSGITPHSGIFEAASGASGSLGYLSQTLSTVAGARYLLSFWLDSPDGSTPNEFLVSWNRTTLFNQTNLPAISWTNLQFTVTATGTSTALQFGFRDDPSWLALDDVSVVLAQLRIVGISLSGTNLVVNGSNGVSGRTCFVLMSTNLTLTLSQWPPVATNVLNANGNFTIIATNAVDPKAPQRFYILKMQ